MMAMSKQLSFYLLYNEACTKYLRCRGRTGTGASFFYVLYQLAQERGMPRRDYVWLLEQTIERLTTAYMNNDPTKRHVNREEDADLDDGGYHLRDYAGDVLSLPPLPPDWKER